MEKFIHKLKEMAEKISYIESVLLVGSYAQGTAKPDSDIDVVIITSDKTKMLENQNFFHAFGEIQHQQVEYYGACTSIRVNYQDGKEVEFGIVDTSWISIPLDAETRQVLSDGYLLLFDKKGFFDDLTL